MFEQTRVLLEQYYCRLLTSNPSQRAQHLLHEVRGRLRGLQWLYARLSELDSALDKSARASRPEHEPVPAVIKQIFTDAAPPDCTSLLHAHLPFSQSDEVRILLEAFYYSAHRIRDILRDAPQDLPRLSSFETVGVRNVRNHLVEHPGKKGGVLVFSIATGGPVGPQLKPLRWSLDDEGTLDAGLHANAAEFERELNSVLTRALAAGAA
jgi:hypothetical protein